MKSGGGCSRHTQLAIRCTVAMWATDRYWLHVYVTVDVSTSMVPLFNEERISGIQF